MLAPGQEFVSAADLPEMQTRLAALLAEPEVRQRLAQAGYEKASRVRNYDDLVNQICGDWAARRRGG